MASTTRVLGVECLGEAEPGQEGVISSRFVPFEELDDETLQMLYEQSPDFVMEKRPDWVKVHYPTHVN